jgi:ubiquinone/menaquinone biosynthesis C-methylase UbiE
MRKEEVSSPVMCKQAATSRMKARKERQTMPIAPEPKREHPSTYFVQDRSNKDEFTRLQLQDHLVTAGMGGVLPEQSDATLFRRVLDVGCGTGGWLIEAAKTYPAISLLVGVDVSNRMLEYARSQAEAEQVSDRVEFHTMDALRMLEFPTGYFDLVNQRFGGSYLRTWDWLKLLQEYQRVVRPGGVVRLTEGELAAESTSAALSRLSNLSRQAFHQAGHLFTPTSDGVTRELTHLLRQHGLQQVQARAYELEWRADTPEGQRLFEDLKVGTRIIKPFLRKWMRVPDDYEDLCQQMCNDMEQPDFVITGRILTAWGNALPSKNQPRSDYPR